MTSVHRGWMSNMLRLVLATSLCLPGCTYFIRATAAKASKSRVSKTIGLHLHRVEPFMECIEADHGACVVHHEAGDAAPPNLLTLPAYTGDQTTTDTRTDRPAVPTFDAADLGRLSAGEQADLAAKLAAQSAAEMARQVLNHPVQQQLNALFDTVKGAAPPTIAMDLAGGTTGALFAASHDERDGLRAEITFDVDTFDDYQRAVEAATLLGGWDALDAEADLYDLHDAGDRRRREYLKEYFAAYFREGRFINARISGAELLQRAKQVLKEQIPGLPAEADYETLAKRLFAHFNFDEETDLIFGRIEDTGFVTRGGQMMQFPAVEAAATLGESGITVTNVDYIAVGSDLIRVLLHAIFDAKDRLPAVSNATGALLPTEAFRLPENDPTATHVEAAEFERIESYASKVEGVISAGTGRVIRGISIFSLGNEALATAIETAVGVAVRKQTEKIVWCWYACRLDEIDDDLGDYAALSFGENVTITITVEGLPAQDMAIAGEASRSGRGNN